MTGKKAVTDLANCDADQLYDLANAGNAEALEALHKHYREEPELVRRHGNLSWLVRESRLKHLLGQEGTRLAIRESMRDLAKRVAGDNPSPLERLLAERIAMCWLDVQDHELRYSLLNAESTFRQFEWRSQMLDRAHRRYLSAIKALAAVRRLALPAVQVNIAEQQVNAVLPPKAGQQ